MLGKGVWCGCMVWTCSGTYHRLGGAGDALVLVVVHSGGGLLFGWNFRNWFLCLVGSWDLREEVETENVVSIAQVEKGRTDHFGLFYNQAVNQPPVSSMLNSHCRASPPHLPPDRLPMHHDITQATGASARDQDEVRQVLQKDPPSSPPPELLLCRMPLTPVLGWLEMFRDVRRGVSHAGACKI